MTSFTLAVSKMTLYTLNYGLYAKTALVLINLRYLKFWFKKTPSFINYKNYAIVFKEIIKRVCLVCVNEAKTSSVLDEALRGFYNVLDPFKYLPDDLSNGAN